MWNFLSEDQRDRYFGQRDDHYGYNKDSVDIINDFSKMVLKTNPSGITNKILRNRHAVVKLLNCLLSCPVQVLHSITGHVIANNKWPIRFHSLIFYYDAN